MRVNSITDGQNFGLKLTKEFMEIAHQQKNALIHKYGLSSPEVKNLIQTIKDIRSIKNNAVLDVHKSYYTPDVIAFVASKDQSLNNFCRFKNKDEFFQNILNFLKIKN